MLCGNLFDDIVNVKLERWRINNNFSKVLDSSYTIKRLTVNLNIYVSAYIKEAILNLDST